MINLLAGFGGLALILGVLAVGISGNRRLYARSLIMLLGWGLIVAATGAEVTAIVENRDRTPDSVPTVPAG